MNALDRREVLVVRGYPGSGKSTWIRQTFSEHHRVYVMPGETFGSFSFCLESPQQGRYLEGVALDVMADLHADWDLCDVVFICSNDHYFMDGQGEYRYDPSRILNAVAFCQAAVHHCMEAGVPVIVDNTHITLGEFSLVRYFAEVYGYTIREHVQATDLSPDELAVRNVHGVPAQTIERMFSRWED